MHRTLVNAPQRLMENTFVWFSLHTKCICVFRKITVEPLMSHGIDELRSYRVWNVMRVSN